MRQLQHYTGQLAKDTATQLKLLQDLQPPGDVGAREQRERLQDEFTKALDNFQRIQREAAEKERQKLEAARLDQEVTLPGPGEGFGGQSRTQMMLEEEDRLKELEDRERAMRQLESDITDVNTIFKVNKNIKVIYDCNLYTFRIWLLWFMSKEKLLTVLKVILRVLQFMLLLELKNLDK